jgi:hypothetical protein
MSCLYLLSSYNPVEYKRIIEPVRKLVNIVLVLGFLFVDFLFFHDIFKAGESTSIAQYLTGILSILVFVISIQSLMKNNKNAKS